MDNNLTKDKFIEVLKFISHTATTSPTDLDEMINRVSDKYFTPKLRKRTRFKNKINKMVKEPPIEYVVLGVILELIAFIWFLFYLR